MPGPTRPARRLLSALTVTFTGTAALAACADEPVAGELEVSVYGGAFVEESIPADAFADGWSVTFEKFLVMFTHDVWLDDRSGYIAFSPIDPSVFDLALPSSGAGHPWGTRPVLPGTYRHVEYSITASSQVSGGNADPEDIRAMARARQSVRVVGEGARGAETVRFDWSFRFGVRHTGCELDRGHVIDGNTVPVQLTIEGERLFRTDLGDEPSPLAFDAIAAADGADGTTPDGAITMAELASVELAGLPQYAPGTTFATSLAGFITALVQSTGGVDGRRCGDMTVTPF